MISRLRRRLTLFDVLCIGVNAIVGSGVFALPDDMHRAMGGYSPLAFALCALLLAPVALCFAELGSTHEDSGGPYLYALRAFGERTGFVIGWFCWINTFVSWAAVTTLFVDLVGVTAYPQNKLFVVAFTASLGLVNYLGVKPGVRVVNLVTIGKMTAILCFVVVGAFAFHAQPLGGALPLGAAGVGQGIYLALFPLQGFEVVPVAAGETVNPRRSVPLGTLGALALSALLFVVVQTVLVGAYPDLGRPSQTPLVDAARSLGPMIGAVVLVGGLVSVGGFAAGSALGAPRYAQAIAARGLLPRSLAAIHPRFETPHVAIVVTTALAAGLGFFFDYRTLIGMSNVVVVIQYAATCLAVPFLRKKAGASPPGAWRVPGGALIPIVGAVASFGLLAGAVVRIEDGRVFTDFSDAKTELLFAAGALVVGVAVAAISRNSARPAAG